MTYPSKGYPVSDKKREEAFYAIHPSEVQKQLERLKVIGANYTNRYMNQCWIQDDEHGFTGWRWDKYNVELYIVSAANRFKDIIVAGPRHYSNAMCLAIDALGGTEILHLYAGNDYDQGFIDQYGTYYNRKEARELATKQKQLRYPDEPNCSDLFSENLY